MPTIIHLPWRRWLIGLLGISIGVLALWLAVRDVALNTLLTTLSSIDTTTVCLALICYLLSLALRSGRWVVLLKDRTRNLSGAGQTLLVGYAVNNILPARLGELFRMEYAHRRLGISRGYVAGAIMVERIIDLLCIGIMLSFGIVGLGSIASVSAEATIGLRTIIFVLMIGIVTIGLLVLAITIVAFYFNPEKTRGIAAAEGQSKIEPKNTMKWLLSEIGQASDAIRQHGRKKWAALGVLSVIMWLMESVALWLVCLSLDVSLDPNAVALLTAVASLSTLIPTAPGYVGTLQLAFVITFSSLGIDAAPAVAAATIQQVVNIGIGTLIGIVLLLSTALLGRYNMKKFG